MKRFAGTILLLLALFPNRVFGNDITQTTGDLSPELIKAHALRKIPDLVWDETPVSTEEVANLNETTIVARFSGRAPSLKGSNLIYFVNDRQFTTPFSEANGSVVIRVPITASLVRVSLRAVNAYGEVFDDAVEISSIFTKRTKAHRPNIDVSLGLTYFDYTESVGQTRFTLSEVGITPKAGVNFRLDDRWEVGGNAFITAIPYKLASSPEALSTARWYGVNGRGGYKLWQPSPHASLHVLGGYYLWGMITPPAPEALLYGVSFLGGPQVFLTGRFQTETKRMYSAYLKFATIQEVLSISLTNRELAIGGSYQINSFEEDSRPWMISLDFAEASYELQSHSFTIRSLTLGIGTRI